MSRTRMILADWFRRLASEAGIELSQYGTGGDGYILGSPVAYHVRAAFIEDAPFLRFEPSDPSHDDVIGAVTNEAIARVASGDPGGCVWYSTELAEAAWSMNSPHFLGTLIQRLGSQTRIAGWRRLGNEILLEFTEQARKEGDGKTAFLAPEAVVKAHFAIPAPIAGAFASDVAHALLEIVGSICTFALGRPVTLPHVVFPSKPESVPQLVERRQDHAVATLARKSVPLAIMGWVGVDGGFPVFERLRAALLTFDAAVKQEHDSVAAILYVVTAECLTTPDRPWRTERLTKRFREFYDELMPSALDQIVQHANFEDAVGVRRGNRSARALRRAALERIYSFRSGQLHEGLLPSYRGIAIDPVNQARRGLFADLAEAAILHFIVAPRSSLVGHPGSADEMGDVASDAP